MNDKIKRVHWTADELKAIGAEMAKTVNAYPDSEIKDLKQQGKTPNFPYSPKWVRLVATGQHFALKATPERMRTSLNKSDYDRIRPHFLKELIRLASKERREAEQATVFVRKKLETMAPKWNGATVAPPTTKVPVKAVERPQPTSAVSLKAGTVKKVPTKRPRLTGPALERKNRMPSGPGFSYKDDGTFDWALSASEDRMQEYKRSQQHAEHCLAQSEALLQLAKYRKEKLNGALHSVRVMTGEQLFAAVLNLKPLLAPRK